MKIKSVSSNNRRKCFEIRAGGRTFVFPHVKAEVRPTASNPPARVWVDADLGREGFSYVLASGREGTVLMDQVLDYNADPAYVRKMIAHSLTVEARKRLSRSGLSTREVARRLRTSQAQLYRLLDAGRPSKPLGQLIELLHVLDCRVDVSVRPRRSA